MRTSCISHRENIRLTVLKEDYWLLMEKDNIAALLLNYFEYWANGLIMTNPKLVNQDSIYVGSRSINEFEQALMGAATSRYIRARLMKLRDMGFISFKTKDGYANVFTVHVANIQKALNDLKIDLDADQEPEATTPPQKDGGDEKEPLHKSTTPPAQKYHPPCTKVPPPPAQRYQVQESEPSQGAEPGSPKNKKESNSQESKEEYTPLPPREVSGSVSNFETSFKMRSQIPEWKIDHTTFREELIKSVHEAFPELYTLPSGKMNRVKILTYLKNLETRGDLNQFEILWSAVKDSVLDQCSGADKSVQQENWLQLMREQGQAFYRDRDGSINAARYQFFAEHSKEVWG